MGNTDADLAGDPSQVEDKAHLDWRDTSHKQWKSKADRSASICYGDGLHPEDAHPTVFQVGQKYHPVPCASGVTLLCQAAQEPIVSLTCVRAADDNFSVHHSRDQQSE